MDEQAVRRRAAAIQTLLSALFYMAVQQTENLAL